MMLLVVHESISMMQMFVRMVLVILLVTIGGIIRHKNRRKRRERMNQRTKRMMKNATRDENGKYPWEK